MEELKTLSPEVQKELIRQIEKRYYPTQRIQKLQNLKIQINADQILKNQNFQIAMNLSKIRETPKKLKILRMIVLHQETQTQLSLKKNPDLTTKKIYLPLSRSI